MGDTREILLAQQAILVLLDVTFLEILEAEVRAEEARRAILKGDATLPGERRRPHPLIGGAIGMIEDQQRDALDLGGRRETEHRFAVAVRAQPLVLPPLVADLPAPVDHLERALVALGLGLCTTLRLTHDLAGVLGPGRVAAQARNNQSFRQLRQPFRAGKCELSSLPHSYSSAATSEPRTAASPGQSAATNAAARIVGKISAAIWNGNS